VTIPIFIQTAYFQIAPKDMPYVQTMMCGSCANENAFKHVFFTHMVTDVQLQQQQQPLPNHVGVHNI